MEVEYKKKNYNSFDIAKFICAILVVMIHVDPFGTQEPGNIAYNMNFLLQHGVCRIAVPLFFAFCGFFLYKKTPLDKFSWEPSKKYLMHILTMYLVWSLVYFPFNYIEILKNSKGILFGFFVYIENLICIASYSHLWYLNALMWAILIISFLLFKKVHPKKILGVSFLFYMIGLFGDSYYGFIAPAQGLPLIGTIITLYFKFFGTTRNGLFFAFFFVALGMFLSNKNDLLSKKKSFAIFIISMFCMTMIPETQKRILDDFEWHGDERPTRHGIIMRNIRSTRREEIAEKQRPRFRITDRIDYDRRRLTENRMWEDRVDELTPDIVEWRDSRTSNKK